MGLRVRVAGRLELPFPTKPQYHREQVQRPASRVFRSILCLPADDIGMDCPEVWVPRYFHDRQAIIDRRVPNIGTDNHPGLAVLAVGCLLFWPSGVKKSFGGFCGSMFVSSIILTVSKPRSNDNIGRRCWSLDVGNRRRPVSRHLDRQLFFIRAGADIF